MNSRNNLRTVKSLFTSVVLLLTILSNYLTEIESKNFAITKKAYEAFLKPIPRYCMWQLLRQLVVSKKMICPPGQKLDVRGVCKRFLLDRKLILNEVV